MSKTRSFRSWSVIFLTCQVLAVLPTTLIYAASLYERSLSLLGNNVAQALPHDYTFVVMGDSRDNDRVFKKALDLAGKQKPLFILHTGDFSSKGSLREINKFLEIVQSSIPDIPLFVVVGNHEKKQLFEKHIGPGEYAIDLERLGARLIVQDNSTYSLKKPQYQYLKKQLEGRQKHTFVSLHIPPQTERWSWHTFTDGADDLMRLLADNRVDIAFFGHIHIFDEATIQGVKYVVTGGAGAPLTPFGFPGEACYHIIVVKVKNGTVSYKMVRIDD